MAEEKEGVKSTVAGWIKGLLTSVVGLVSGAIIMYLTPLVNNAIKPAKPVSNFAHQVVGLNVNFNNRSTGATQGWWDFGDGTALEPFDPKLETVAHPYRKPGTYTVKLSLQNIIGEASDRSTPVTIDNDTAPKLDFASFELKAVTPEERAPALYRLKAKISGATHCILCAGDNRAMEVIDDPSNLDRLINFDETGMYTIRLAAVNGKQLLEKSKDIIVGVGESGELLAKLKVTYEAARVERISRVWRIQCDWQADLKDAFSPFRRERLADPGCTITSVAIVNKSDPDAPGKLECKPSQDKTKLVLTGELARPTGALANGQTPPAWLAEVQAMMERRSPVQPVNRGDLTMAVVPGRATKIPLQALSDRWDVVRTQAIVEIWDNDRMVWSGEPPIANAPLKLRNQACTISAVKQSDGVLVTIVAPNVPALPVVLPKAAPVEQPIGPTIRKTGFEFDPRRPLAPNK